MSMDKPTKPKRMYSIETTGEDIKRMAEQALADLSISVVDCECCGAVYLCDELCEDRPLYYAWGGCTCMNCPKDG